MHANMYSLLCETRDINDKQQIIAASAIGFGISLSFVPLSHSDLQFLDALCVLKGIKASL